jgi:hypothetical protein
MLLHFICGNAACTPPRARKCCMGAAGRAKTLWQGCIFIVLRFIWYYNKLGLPIQKNSPLVGQVAAIRLDLQAGHLDIQACHVCQVLDRQPSWICRVRHRPLRRAPGEWHHGSNWGCSVVWIQMIYNIIKVGLLISAVTGLAGIRCGLAFWKPI